MISCCLIFYVEFQYLITSHLTISDVSSRYVFSDILISFRLKHCKAKEDNKKLLLKITHTYISA